MSVSLYFTAVRSVPLSAIEKDAIQKLEAKYAVEEQLLRYARTGNGLNWESWCVYDSACPTARDVIYEGATALPDNTEDACWIGLQHWCLLLSSVRHAVPGADWTVHLDDHEIVWDARRAAYDPSR